MRGWRATPTPIAGGSRPSRSSACARACASAPRRSGATTSSGSWRSAGWSPTTASGRGMTQQELAVLCGTTQSAIARLERGGRPPKLDTLMRIADALDAELLLEMRLRPSARRVGSRAMAVTLRDFMSERRCAHDRAVRHAVARPRARFASATSARPSSWREAPSSASSPSATCSARSPTAAIPTSDQVQSYMTPDPVTLPPAPLPERGGPDHERAPLPPHPGHGERRARRHREHPRPHVGAGSTSAPPTPTWAPISPRAPRRAEYRFGGRAGALRRAIVRSTLLPGRRVA